MTSSTLAHPTPTAPAAPTHPADAPPAAGRHHIVFTIAFHSELTYRDMSLLSRELGIDSAPQAKVPSVPRGVARLNFDSGLFLVPGASAGEWRLVCRTWGWPVRVIAHGWAIQALHAVRQLDPEATLVQWS